MTPLYAELNRWMGTPFIWGETDCIMVLCDWIKTVRGVDPASGDRFTYDDAGSCQRATRYFSQPVETLDSRFAPAGIRRGNELRAGDVGLIKLPDERHPVGGIWTGDCWGCKGPNGTTTVAPAVAEVLAFWSVGYEA